MKPLQTKALDMKDIAILDAFPLHDYPKTVLEVGCGDGKLDFHLAEIGFRVYATDIHRYDTWEDSKKIGFYQSDIFDLSSFPIKSSPITICSQVLEHLSGYKTALVHLLALTEIRLIITVPYRLSFPTPDHVNFWDDKASTSKKLFQCLNGPKEYADIYEFATLCHPYNTAISKIRTKPADAGSGQYDYLIVVDKRQNK